MRGWERRGEEVQETRNDNKEAMQFRAVANFALGLKMPILVILELPKLLNCILAFLSKTPSLISHHSN